MAVDTPDALADDGGREAVQRAKVLPHRTEPWIKAVGPVGRAPTNEHEPALNEIDVLETKKFEMGEGCRVMQFCP